MKITDVHLNSPSILPPVDTPLLIEYNGELVRAYRDTYIKRRSNILTYVLNATSPSIEGSGARVEGRFRWTFA